MEEFDKFVNKLQEIRNSIENFKEKSIDEIFHLLDEMKQIKKIVSKEARIDLRKAKFKIRRYVLTQIIESGNSDEFKSFSVDDCWKYFVFVCKFEYDKGGSGHGPYWSGLKISKKAKESLFPFLFEKVVAKIKKGGKEKDYYMKMLSGIKARYNSSDKEHIEVNEIMKKFDPSKIYEYKWI